MRESEFLEGAAHVLLHGVWTDAQLAAEFLHAHDLKRPYAALPIGMAHVATGSDAEDVEIVDYL